METGHEITVDIRWMIRRDLPEVLEIEQACFCYPCDENDIRMEMTELNVIGMVAVREDRVAGFIIYKLNRTKLDIIRLAVHPEYQRKRIGTELVKRLQEKVQCQDRDEIEVHISEQNLASQLFFRANGFQAVDILEDFYEAKGSEGSTAYHFSWLCGEKFGTEFNE